jgi:U3 small nucleolar RNA-associated protein 14
VGDLLTQLSGVHHHSATVVAGNTDADGTVFEVEDAYASEDDEQNEEESESESEYEEEDTEPSAAPGMYNLGII